MPIGPGKLVAGKSSGIFARVIEGWQATWIVDLASGNPSNITAQSMLYANGVPDRVGNFDPSSGHVQWKEGALAGNYFGDAYHRVPDPQCARIAPILQSANLCTLSAIADANGNIVLQNPLPGTRGNLGQNIIETPGTWTLDMSMGKGIKLTETKKLSLRMDATNILNHPQVSNPDLNINGSVPFGNIATKTGQRQFQAQLRLDF